MKPDEQRGDLEHIKPLALAILLGIVGGLIQGYTFGFWRSPSNNTSHISHGWWECLLYLLSAFLLSLFIISPCIPVIGGSALKLPIAYLTLAVLISKFSVVPFCDTFWHLTEEEEMMLFKTKMIPSYILLLLWAGFFLTLKVNLTSILFLIAVLLSYAFTFRCIKRGIRDRDDLIFAVLILLLI
jgi:uncharacterized membrane protein YccF (DUF307 family)